MSVFGAEFSLDVFLQIIFIDVVLAGDNAIIVGMVASRVDPDLRQRVILFGVGAAVVMRILFSLVAVQMLAITGLTLIGGLLLLWVSWRLIVELREGHAQVVADEAGDVAHGDRLSTMRPAIMSIVIADLSMSIDNVLAIAGVARDHEMLLVFGLALSVALMIFAATLIARLLQRYPLIAWLGVVLILWVSVKMIYEGGHEVLQAFA